MQRFIKIHRIYCSKCRNRGEESFTVLRRYKHFCLFFLQHLSLNNDHNAYTVTATLRRNQLSLDLIGRYTCSEIINGKKSETSAYVYIVDGISVFTKRSYPKVLPQTGVHFFNIPCQTASWYAKMSCPTNKDSKQCKARECSPRERQVNELKCNIPICEGDDLCIPVYLNPADLQATVCRKRLKFKRNEFLSFRKHFSIHKSVLH